MMVREGTWFALPVRGGGFALGLIARKRPRGSVAFGYVFGDLLSEIPNVRIASGLTHDDAIWCGKFLVSALKDGHWPVVGQLDSWRRETWPMPSFAVEADPAPDYYLTTFAEDDPEQVVSYVKVNASDVQGKPVDSVDSPWYVEDHISRLIRGSLSSEKRDSHGEQLPAHRFFLLFPDMQSAVLAGYDVRTRSSFVTSVVPNEEGHFMIVETDDSTLAAEEVDQLEGWLGELAEKYGGQYDGMEQRIDD